jgi:hypothetical protein
MDFTEELRKKVLGAGELPKNAIPATDARATAKMGIKYRLLDITSLNSTFFPSR